MANFTKTQGRYLSFIHAYTKLHGIPPAEAEIAADLSVSPPLVNQMVKTLEKKGLIFRQPGAPRSIQVRVPEEEIPSWDAGGGGGTKTRSARTSKAPNGGWVAAASPPANLYVLTVFLASGPVDEKFGNREISRVIEIRGDQTLERLHQEIFQAFDRFDEHLYEFQFGRRPMDPKGPNYGLPNPLEKRKNYGDARTTKLDDLDLSPESVFGYWFDFGDDWYHQIQVERIEQAIPTVAYPRVIKRKGKSPPQYLDE